jgi:Fuc2NAc and GlcNAc transferase
VNLAGVNLVDAAIVLTAFAAAFAGSGAVRRYALKNRIMDIPNDRSSHSRPTPRGGGLAIVIAFLAAATILRLVNQLPATMYLALSAGAAVAGIGFLDDRYQVSALSRFTVHIAAALLVLAVLGAGDPAAAASSQVTRYLFGAFAMIFALTWATNLFNFMDGIDGLAATEAIFISTGAALLNSIARGDPGVTTMLLCLCASVSGFLAWNWPPARLFMGDVGSGFLGFTLAALAFGTSAAGRVPMAAWLILGGLFVIDASITLVLRMMRGERWTEPHRTHAYQQLTRRWASHRKVTLASIAINVGWLLPWAIVVTMNRSATIIYLVIALLPLVVLALMAGAGRAEVPGAISSTIERG